MYNFVQHKFCQLWKVCNFFDMFIVLVNRLVPISYIFVRNILLHGLFFPSTVIRNNLFYEMRDYFWNQMAMNHIVGMWENDTATLVQCSFQDIHTTCIMSIKSNKYLSGFFYVAYFFSLTKMSKQKWSVYSMLCSTLAIRKNIDIKYIKATAFWEQQNEKYLLIKINFNFWLKFITNYIYQSASL